MVRLKTGYTSFPKKLRAFLRYKRRYARHQPPGLNRQARRAHMQQPQFPRPIGWHGIFTFENLKHLFFLPLKTQGPPKPKRTYEKIHDSKGREMLREVRVIDRRPLKEIRKTRREQTV